MRFKKKNLVFLAIMIISTLLLSEFALQVLSLVSPRINALLSRPPRVSFIKDERLGTKPIPHYPGHDQKGFRNKSVPKKVSIVAMGDSQTYGTAVWANQAWPQQLEKLGKIKIYNMAWMKYGPTHSLLLLKEAMALKPELIIETFYVGNDLYDSYHHVYEMNQLLDLKSTDETVIQAIANIENIEPLTKQFVRHWKVVKSDKQKPPTQGIFRAFLREHSKIYGVLRAVRRSYTYGSNILDWELIKQEALKNREDCLIFDNGKIKTVLMPNRRLCALNLNDPRIIEGYRISLEAIRLMKERAQKVNIKFIVLLIPTKEMVFKNVIYEDLTDIPKAYNALIENEELVWQKTKDFLKNQGIYFIDSLSVLRGCIQDGNQPYQVSWDAHLNSIAYRAIAELVLSELKKGGGYW